MELGMIGLGRMGAGMAERLLKGGHRLVVYDPQKAALDAVAGKGAAAAVSVVELCQKLARPKAVWLMVPAGEATEATIVEVAGQLNSGDIIIDGGNSNYLDSRRRGRALARRGTLLLDVGTSGGVWGEQQGYCLMVGGDEDAYRRLEPVFQSLAPAPHTGYGHVGPSGAGHYVKMVHNAIEYGLMEAYAEGFDLLKAREEMKLNLPQVAEVWRHGSVIRSWLLDLTAAALKEDPALSRLSAYVEDSGEGRWAVKEAADLGVPIPAISQALQVRFRSRRPEPLGEKLLAALRQQFGGHPARPARP
jgi:6-phosphogluconate dehydrogenase